MVEDTFEHYRQELRDASERLVEPRAERDRLTEEWEAKVAQERALFQQAWKARSDTEQAKGDKRDAARAVSKLKQEQRSILMTALASLSLSPDELEELRSIVGYSRTGMFWTIYRKRDELNITTVESAKSLVADDPDAAYYLNLYAVDETELEDLPGAPEDFARILQREQRIKLVRQALSSITYYGRDHKDQIAALIVDRSLSLSSDELRQRISNAARLETTAAMLHWSIRSGDSYAEVKSTWTNPDIWDEPEANES